MIKSLINNFISFIDSYKLYKNNSKFGKIEVKLYLKVSMSNKRSHKDNCGTGVIFSKTNTPSNSIIFRSLLSLSKMKHRGAVSHDGETPDGCGILIDLDRKFFPKMKNNSRNALIKGWSKAIKRTLIN